MFTKQPAKKDVDSAISCKSLLNNSLKWSLPPNTDQSQVETFSENKTKIFWELENISKEMDGLCGTRISVDVRNPDNRRLVSKRLLAIFNSYYFDCQRLVVVIEWITQDWCNSFKLDFIGLLTSSWSLEAKYSLWRELKIY